MALKSALTLMILTCMTLSAQAQIYSIIGGSSAEGRQDLSLRVVQLKSEAFSPTMGKLKGSCSGVLLSPTVVLTAGHCVKSVDTDTVVRKITASVAGVEIEAQRWVANPEYGKIQAVDKSGDVIPLADLAIIELKSPVPRTAVISELPTAELSKTEKQFFLISDFGQTEASKLVAGNLSFALSTGQLIDVAEGKDVQIKIEGPQACHGDSGGPVYQPKNGHYVLVGIISNGKSDCSGETKAMSVFHHLPWIQKLLDRLVQ